MAKYTALCLVLLTFSTASAFTINPHSSTFRIESKRSTLNAVSDRRNFLLDGASIIPLSTFFLTNTPSAYAVDKSQITTSGSGLLPDLPPDASRSYLQYRTPLQISADYYLFDLRDQVKDTNSWGEIGQLFNGQNARGGQGQPSAIERNFINPMRILALSMPPDTADEMRAAQFDFEVGYGICHFELDN